MQGIVFGCFSHRYLTTIFFKNLEYEYRRWKITAPYKRPLPAEKEGKVLSVVMNDTSIIYIYKCVLVEFSREIKW